MTRCMNDTHDVEPLADTTASDIASATKNIEHPSPKNRSTKRDLFGVAVDAVDADMAFETITHWAQSDQPATVAFTPVHGLVTAARDATFRQALNSMDMVAPDGQPVRWALGWFHGEKLRDRVYGPHTMWRLCQWAAANGVGIYLYGSSPEVLDKLTQRLRKTMTGIDICGAESPPFRALTEAEDAAAVDRINASGAKLIFVGLGCPKQEMFVYEHRDRIHAVQLTVGAAFDFHAGTLAMAPAWMQQRGLEWLYRLMREPRRLWRRYFVTNSIFLGLCAKRVLFGSSRRSPLPTSS